MAKKRPAAKKAPAKSTSKQRASATASAPQSTTAKKTPAKKTPAKKTPAKKTPAKKTPAKKSPASKTPAKKRPAEAPAAATTEQAITRATSRASSSTTKKTTTPMSEITLPKPRFNKDGLGYTKDFPLSFIKEMYEALQAERIRLTGQANRLEEEAHSLVEDGEMGDVQFDEEGGEGDAIAVERERDLTLSAQARETVREIDDALKRIANGRYGYSIVSGQPIPTERLEVIPWSSVLVEEKVGGIGRR